MRICVRVICVHAHLCASQLHSLSPRNQRNTVIFVSLRERSDEFVYETVPCCKTTLVTMDIEKLQQFMELVGRLKHMKRTGWVLRNVPDPETISGHMYRMAMLSFLVDTKENLDRVKIMQMTLIHDLAECIVGDITPHCGVSPEEKHRREDQAMVEICELLGDKGPEILEMFREYEKQESPEARYVKDLDRLDLIMQAYEYEKLYKVPGKFDEFFANANGKIIHPFISKVANDIWTKRNGLCQESNSVNNQDNL